MAKKDAPLDPTPEPLAPMDDVLEDATAVPLTWDPVHGAGDYHVQVSSDVGFGRCHFDAPVGNTSHLTIFSMLPVGEQALYWRVRADEGPWSEPATFWIGGGEESRKQAEAHRQAVAQHNARAVADERAQQEVPIPEPFRSGQTSRMEAVFLVLLFVIVMLVLAWILLAVSTGRLAGPVPASAAAMVPVWHRHTRAGRDVE